MAATFAVGLSVSTAATHAAGATVEVKPRPKERRVDVFVDRQPFTAYVWPERLVKPVLFPIRTVGGISAQDAEVLLSDVSPSDSF
jgi:hypothetical protein